MCFGPVGFNRTQKGCFLLHRLTKTLCGMMHEEIEKIGGEMTDSLSQSEEPQAGPLSHPHTMRDILIVGSPIIIMGIVGNLVG